jgi:hypothetical protein
MVPVEEEGGFLVTISIVHYHVGKMRTIIMHVEDEEAPVLEGAVTALRIHKL